MATGLTGEEQKAVAEFRAQVVEPSMEKLVILDFYADWCGPCKAIAPMLEKIAAEYADKGVIVEKIDVDKNKFVASQFQVQSIPTIFAIFQGQPIANLTQARTKSQMKQVIDQLLAKLPIVARSAADGAEDVAPLVAMAQELMEQGDMERALGIFAQLSEMAPKMTKSSPDFCVVCWPMAILMKRKSVSMLWMMTVKNCPKWRNFYRN